MTKYQGQVRDRMTSEIVKKTKWYTTWEQAHRAADTKTWQAARYQIEVVDADGND